MATSKKTSSLCPACHVGHLRQERSTYTQWHEGQLVVVPNVPVQICDYCGETHYHHIVLERLHQLLWADTGQQGNFPSTPRSGRSKLKGTTTLNSDP